MTNSSIEYQIKRKRFFESKSKPDRSFKTLTQKWKAPRISKKKLLPDLTLYPSDWTYLVSNEKRPHTITVDEFRKKKLKQGDKVYFNRGEIYNFVGYDVAVNNVLFGAYGAGADPIFRGSDATTTFTSEAGGYYSMPLATAPLWVVNPAGEMARQGETDWIVSTAVATSTTITGDATTLNAFNSVEALANNAKLRHKEFNFRLSYEHLVTGYNTGTGVLTIGAGGVGTAAAGLPFKLYGQKQYATQEGDWWYDDANNELWIKTVSDPTGLGWRVITEDYAFNVGTSTGVTIENIEFTQYFESAIEAPDAPTLTITGVNIHDNRQNGLLLYGNSTSVTCSNFTIERCGLQGVHIGAIVNSTFSDFTINEIGEQSNIGWPVDTYWIKTGGCGIAYFWDSAETTKVPMNVDVSDGVMTNLGYMGILVTGDNHNITDCRVQTFCTKWNDGGGFYTIHRTSLGPSTKNVIFTRCIAHDGIGGVDGIGEAAITPKHAEGFYVDNGSELITFDQCISFNNSDRGILCNWDTQKTTITDCIVANNGGDSQIRFVQDTDIGDSPVFQNNDGNVLTGCLIVSHNLTYCVMKQSFNNDANYNPFSDSGNCDNNTYVRPYGASVNVSRADRHANIVAYTLANWQSHISDDASSTAVVSQLTQYRNPTIGAEEVVVTVNTTTSPINVNGTGYNDLSGSPLGATNNLDPGEVLVMILITQTTPDLLYDTFTAANGTNLSGRSPAVGPTPTIAAGTHTIQSNAWATSVNGRVTWNINQSDFYFTISQNSSNLSQYVTYFRWVNDSNRFVIAIDADEITLFEFNASASATNTWVRNFDFFASNTYIFSIEAVGASIKVYVNGILTHDVTTSYTTAGHVGALGNTARVSDYILAGTP